MKRILFCHKNFPAQFGDIANYMNKHGWRSIFLTAREEVPTDKIKRLNNIDVLGYRNTRQMRENQHRYLLEIESAINEGQSAASAMIKLRGGGFVPDIVVAHTGWGTGSFAKAVFPDAKFVPYLEWWYNFPAIDINETIGSVQNQEDARARRQANNLSFLLDIQVADHVLCPTHFQFAQFPKFVQDMSTVIHDGVDCELYSPGAPESFTRVKLGIPEDAPILTYATRGMESKRGFGEFMAMASRLQKEMPELHVIVGGENTGHYQGSRKTGDKEKALAENSFDIERLHFPGRMPPNQYRDMLRMSDVYVYFTMPFVLSWSCINAMATGCAMVVSENDAVREALPSADMAVHINHFDIDQGVAAIKSLLNDPEKRTKLGKAARAQALAEYNQPTLFAKRLEFFNALL